MPRPWLDTTSGAASSNPPPGEAAPSIRRAAIPLALVQNTPEWEAARQSVDFFGASDVPIITGSSPYKGSSAYDLWAYKTGRLDRLPLDEDTEELFALGHALEPVISDRFEVLSGWKLRRVNRTLRHPEVEWAVASLDRVVVGQRIVVEIKWDPWARFSRAAEGIPPHVLEQVQWQLLVSGYESAEVAVLQGSHISRFEVAPDRSFQDDLLFIVERFRENCLAGVAPPIDGSEATRKAIARLHPDDNGEQMEPTAELAALMARLREAQPVAAAATEEVDRLKNAIRSTLGDYSGSRGDGWSVSFKKTKPRKTVDWKAVAAAYRRLAAAARDTFGLDIEDWRVTEDGDPLDAIESLHTTESEGSRSLRPTFDEEGGHWT